MQERMESVYKCWKCNETLVKASSGKRGLIKSQVAFFDGDQLIGRCKKCGENNILPITIGETKFAEPKLTIPVPSKNLRKSVDRKPIRHYNNINSRKNLIKPKDINSKRSKSPGKK